MLLALCSNRSFLTCTQGDPGLLQPRHEDPLASLDRETRETLTSEELTALLTEILQNDTELTEELQGPAVS